MRLASILHQRSNIANRLSAWFLLIALIPCVILLALTLHFSSQSLEASTKRRLMLICDSKAAQLEEYITERRADALFLSKAPGFVEAVTQLDRLVKAGQRPSEEYDRLAKNYRTRIGDYVEVGMYENLTLFNTDGVPLVSYRSPLDYGPSLLTGPLNDSELASGFTRTRALLQPILTNVQIYPGATKPSSFVVGPMFRDGALVGVLALELDNAQVFKSFNTYFGLGETGDTTAAVEVGDELLYVSPTRFDPNTAFRDRIKFGDARGADIQLAVRGHRGLRRDGRPPRQACRHCLDVPPVVPLGDHGQAKRRGGVRPPGPATKRGDHLHADRPPSGLFRRSPGRPVAESPDPRGCTGRHAGCLGRPDRPGWDDRHR